jgi:O-antigen ligase
MNTMGDETTAARIAQELKNRVGFHAAAVVAAVAVLTLTVLVGPLIALIVVAVVVVLLVLAARPHWSIYATIFLGLTTFPAFIPYQFQIGPTTIFSYEPALIIAAAWALLGRKPASGVLLRASLLVVIVVAWGAAGVIQRYPGIEVIGDARGLINVTLCAVVAAVVFGSSLITPVLRALLVSLWISAAVTLVSSVSGLSVVGRSEDAGLVFINGVSTSSSATRLLTPSSEVAVLVVCACVALFMMGRFRLALPFFVPALLITGLGFSRNSVLAIAAAALFALLLAGNKRSFAAVLKLLLAIAAVSGLVALGAAAGLPGTTYIVTQVQGFVTRVVEGLGSTAISLDSSAIARESENRYALQAIQNAPVFGHGLGFAYRPPYGPVGSFSATKGQFYAHNFYLWTLVKAGAVGLLIFLLAVLVPVVAVAKGRSRVGIMLSSTGLGLLASLAFAPFVNDPDNGGSLAVGVVIGAVYGCVVRGREAGAQTIEIGDEASQLQSVRAGL